MKSFMKSKKISIVTLSLCAAACAGLAFVPQVFTAKADVDFSNTVTGFTQKDGAGIRYGTEASVGSTSGATDGIRFQASITNAALDELTDGDPTKITDFGMLIVKGDAITSENVDTALANGTKHSATGFDVNYTYTETTDDDNEEHTFRVAVYGIQDKMKKYAARAYITVDDVDYYANVTKGYNIRSAFQVAEAMKADGYLNEGGTEASAEQKSYIDGVINEATQGVEYAWDDTTSTYYVKGVADATLATGKVEILGEYETIKNGKADVTYLGNGCFQDNTTITHLILPESVTELRTNCCYGMTGLVSVAMPGVSEITNTSYNNQFLRCTSLATVIVKNGFYVSVQCFQTDKDTTLAGITQVYSLATSGATLKVPSKSTYNRFLIGTNGSALPCYGTAVCGSGTWKYAADGYTVVPAKAAHEYEANGKCKHCGAYNTMGVTYTYVAGANDDEANGVYTGSYQVTDIVDSDGEANKALLEQHGDDYVLRILEKYNDGTHGELNVTSVKYQAFRSTSSTTTNLLARNVITHLILPSTVTTLDAQCFANMLALEYVYMLGVTDMRVDGNTGPVQFQNCNALKGIIVQKGLIMGSASFSSTSNTGARIYVMEADGTFNFVGNNAVFGDTTRIVYDEDGVCGSGTWKYADDGYTVVAAEEEHSYVEGACEHCGETEPAA